ncbi:MAG: hypothetical protein J0L83_05785 [Chitinophagales bacterium]|nr:hypothetical protein [Chitinophagales bacterium]
MNKESRIQNIERSCNEKDNLIGEIEIPWKDGLESMKVYKIPLEYLVYNKYNGRILSRTKSLESQHQMIDVETDYGRDLIAKLLWDSKVDRNKKTLETINAPGGGQQKPGIITRDGIIIDGNRRAMLLRKSGKYSYFKAVVLPVTLDENPLEIEKLETSFQMGEDEKLGYNPIEKYLKAKSLYKKLSGENYLSKNADLKSIQKIADWMGEDSPTVKEYLEVMCTMDDYLDYLEYNGIYTQLDGREDQFIQLTRWLNNFYGSESAKAFDGYRDDDVDDLKTIAYDYIRIKYEGKQFRHLAYGLRENHFFGDKEIWTSFRDYHFEKKQKITEDSIDLNSQNLERHLNDRDNKFYEKSKLGNVESFLKENDDTHYTWLRNKQSAGQPEKLVRNAIRSLESINQRNKNFKSPEVSRELEILNNSASQLLANSSIEKLFSHIITLLQKIDITKSTEDKESIIKKAKTIQQIVYKMTKEI